MTASPSRIAARWLQAASLSQDAMEFLSILALGKPKMLPMNAASEALGALGLTVTESNLAVPIKDYTYQVSMALKPFGIRGIKRVEDSWKNPAWFKLTFSSPRSAKSGAKKLMSVGKVVSSEPSSPRPETLYVKDIEHDGDKSVTGEAWIGAFAWEVSGLPGGNVLVPMTNDGRGNVRGNSRDLLKALKSNGYEMKAFDILNEADAPMDDSLGGGGSSSQTRDLDGTGTCPACFANVKLTSADLIRRHGWTEVGGRQKGNYGQVWHSGACFGVNYKPYELSKEGTEDFRDQRLVPLIDSLETALAGIEAGTEPIRSDKKTIEPDDPKYSQYQPFALRQIRSQIIDAKKDLRTLDARVSGWKPQPLPGKTASVHLPPWGQLIK